jgi:hypothetical protein
MDSRDMDAGRTEALEGGGLVLVGPLAMPLIDPREHLTHAQDFFSVDGNVRSLPNSGKSKG